MLRQRVPWACIPRIRAVNTTPCRAAPEFPLCYRGGPPALELDALPGGEAGLELLLWELLSAPGLVLPEVLLLLEELLLFPELLLFDVPGFVAPDVDDPVERLEPAFACLIGEELELGFVLLL